MLNIFSSTPVILNSVTGVSDEIASPNLARSGGQLFYSFLVFIFVLFLAYYLTKWVSKKKLHVMNTKNIKILEILSVGVGVSLAIIEVGERCMLVSISKEKVTFVSELDKNSLSFKETGNGENNFSQNFNEQLKKLLNKGKKEDDKADKFL